MDSITHIVFGAVTGEMIAGKKIGKKAMLWGVLANSLPDIDVFSDIWLHEPDSLIAHRGITHSFFFSILISVALAFLMKKFSRQPMRYTDWFIIFLSGTVFHICIDALTTYGTGLFEPFSHQRFSLNTIFVADPFFTISLLIASVALLILKRDSLLRKKWALFGISISTAYLVYTFYHKVVMENKFNQAFHSNQIKVNRFFSTPTPLNNWLWYAIGTNDDSLYVAYHSVFEKSDSIKFKVYAVNSELLQDFSDTESVNKLKYFSQGYYTVQRINDTLIFSDARFGQVGGWNNKKAAFVFKFNLTKDADNSMVIQKGRFEGSANEAFKSLYHRIFYFD